ncbi:HAMP domain-containing histidine kinase [Nonomuraea sp. PA05]|uniref:sensor histidine kinase n=1 Tax=Nonomuraea sp. PA05 TaxID=2604466 RepID=UPI0011D842C1|nr:HAMP domain-containing sensor histidine kinase [Nonomuraea sp. PA05]TYB64828.1 HAMP domain-containing histidine kinase [Nonomuraea sp. PA05]
MSSKASRGRLPYPRSIRARFSLAVGALFLVVLTAVGALTVSGVRHSIATEVFEDLHLAIVDWVSRMRPGYIPAPRPGKSTVHVRYLQLVDSRGRVVASNLAASGRAALSTVKPVPGDGMQDLTVCPPWRTDACLLVTVLLLDPQMPDAPLKNGPHYIYAGAVQPVALAKPYMQVGLGAAVLVASAVAAWATRVVVDRTLRPVRAISTRMREATAKDLSMRVPTPLHDDEIAEFAHASNSYLDRLEKAVKARHRFASLASHELRSPVTALRTQLEEALMYPADVDAGSALRNALHSTERLEAIIDDLLAYTRVKDAPLEAYHELDLVSVVEEELAALPPDGIPIRLRAASRPRVRGSRVQLGRVLNNLLANARRHARTHVHVTVEQVGDQAEVTVQDDGVGIDPEDRERVFDAFVRLPEGRRLDPGGSGLGLAISRETCLAHGGSLTVENCPRGTRFVLRLPVPGPDS